MSVTILRTNRARRGQSVLEYAAFVSVVAAAVAGMSLYIRRSIQANIKGIEERLNSEAR